MIEDEISSAGIGHNAPALNAELLIAELRDRLETDYRGRLDEFVASCGRCVIRDREDAGKAADLVRLARKFLDRIEGVRVERTQPLRDAASSLMNVETNFREPLDFALDGVQAKIDEFQAAERKRIADQLAEQRRVEEQLRKDKGLDPAAVSLPSAPPAKTKRRTVRGDYGAQIIEKAEKIFTVVDVRLVPDSILNSPKVTEAIISVARDLSKHMPDIPGIKIDHQVKDQVR